MEVTINSRKFDGSVHRSWRADCLGDGPDLLEFRGVFERPVEHPQLGTIAEGTISYEYFWPAKWFSIFRFHEPDGTLRNWYCNVNLPPTFDGQVLDFVDLDLDVLVWADFRTELLDRDDFEQNAKRFRYPADVVAGAEDAIGQIDAMIAAREFPFSD